ncbi:transposase [Synoicihabitans lomoniglobus]|uniref:Transposase n=1 Tax=Synoicihabitans lomoniglobus TaxID=2909285 RepID=A0AAE9ZU82_9BACT|nr:transposase [Opitutaceae bacterium LMO-M01]WED65259.1 transposase [Opitutaceae bacterium LMO-M01]
MNKPTINPGSEQLQSRWLNVCVDVSKQSLNWAFECDDKGRLEEGIVPNANTAIPAWLDQIKARAKALGFTHAQVICEPTGGYEKRLLKLARQHGCMTALVSGESVHQMQVVQNNDTGKSDWKDPRTMLLLAKWGKTLTDRELTSRWLALRELGAYYDRLERGCTQTKNRIHKTLLHLCSELSFKKDWLFKSRAAGVVLELYGFNPASMLAPGWSRFRERLRRRKLYHSTIARLWHDAQACELCVDDELWREELSAQLREHYADLRLVQQRMQACRDRMIGLLEQLQRHEETRLQAHPGLISPFLLARVLAETGPLNEFASVKQLLRYGGLNLRPRQSGSQRGQDRQSKKGRARLRHVLSQAVLKRVVRGQLYGEYYHGKRAEGMCGAKAMTAVARKFLKLLYGLERSATTYDPQRVFACESATRAAA